MIGHWILQVIQLLPPRRTTEDHGGGSRGWGPFSRSLDVHVNWESIAFLIEVHIYIWY